MDYRIFQPSPDLAAFVKCYWTLESPAEANPDKQTIVPDGCPEMIFHYGDLYRQCMEDGSFVAQPRCFAMGQLTRPLEIKPEGATGIFAVRFHPDGFQPFAGIPLKAMENSANILSRVLGPEGTILESAMLDAKSTEERITRIEQFLSDRLSQSETVDRIVKSAVETILTANGQLPVDALTKLMQINRRQLERKFSASIGLSPKQLSKTVRLQAALKMLIGKDFKNLTALAHAGDYYDQAHFIRDFKELTGLTPKEFYGDSLKMSALFYGSA